MSDRVDAVTSLVKGLVRTPVVNVQPTLSSDFDRLVEPSGVDPRHNSDHTVGEPFGPSHLTGRDFLLHRGNSVLSAVLRPPEVVKGLLFSADIKERMKNVTRRSNAA